MIQFEIKGISYEVPSHWGDVTLEKWIHFSKEVAPFEPEIMRGEQEVTQSNYAKIAVPYMVRYVSFWSGAPEAVLMRCRVKQLEELYFSVLYSLVPYSPDVDVPAIEHDGQIWHLPKKAFESSTVGEFMLASQYQDKAEALGKNQWEVLPSIMCIVLQKEGEAFEQAHFAREADFLKWPMDKCFQVSFFLLRLGMIYLQDFQFSQSALTLSRLVQELKN